jgi:D-alanyl-lipoteichoic acid acyltransferase DltB (MBOAT superfamily)
MLEQPPLLLFILGTIGFSIQIYADFSAYTDIARGTAKLFGFNLINNFNSPYLAISPSDFWRRWHISFSSWIRDYLYIPMGGSRVKTKFRLFFVIMCSMGLSGLWHGAAWTFVVWGLYHGLLIFSYRSLGLGGKWKPKTLVSYIFAWIMMVSFTCTGWSLFRAKSISWLFGIFDDGFSWGFSGDSLTTSVVIALYLLFYTVPLLLFLIVDRLLPTKTYIHGVVYTLSFIAITVFFRSSGQDFIYFQF